MKQPDRFERIVKARMEKDGGIWSDTAIDLLRNEHAWMRRQLQAIARVKFGEGLLKTGVDTAIEEIVYRLDQRRK